MASQELVAEGLFTRPSDEPQPIGSERDGRLSFPARPGETRTLLGCRGRLWAFTTQRYRPPSPPYDGDDTPENFQPYALGYVELPGELLVQGRFTESDPARLRVGMDMEVVVVPYAVRPDGTEVLTYAFAPVAGREVCRVAADLRDRAAAPGPRRRPPGSELPGRRLHPSPRRARSVGGHDPLPLIEAGRPLPG